MSKRRKVSVDVLAPEKGEIAPFVGYYANANPHTAGAEVPDFELYEHHMSERVQRHVVVGRQATLDYVGRDYGKDVAGPQSCRYALGMYNKETGKLQLMPANGNLLLRLETKLHGMDYGASMAEAEEQEEASREARVLQAKKLVESFGSTRRRRQLNEREQGRLQAGQLTSGAALVGMIGSAAAAAAAAGMTREEVMARATAQRAIPPHNPGATRGEDAYSLYRLVPGGSLAVLRTGAVLRLVEDMAARQAAVQKRQYPEYVVARAALLSKLLASDKEVAKRRAACLAYLAPLLRLYASPKVLRSDPAKGGLAALARPLGCSEELAEGLLELFYNAQREGEVTVHMRSDAQRHLLLLYVLVVALLAEGCALGPDAFEALKSEIKMKANDLAARYRELGAVCSAVSLKAEGDSSGLPEQHKSYSVALLKEEEDPPKTLADCFPALKVGRAKAK